jgi:hypothetical protein
MAILCPFRELGEVIKRKENDVIISKCIASMYEDSIRKCTKSC